MVVKMALRWFWKRPQAGVAPGQACVFYDGERMLGGGWIARRESAAVAA